MSICTMWCGALRAALRAALAVMLMAMRNVAQCLAIGDLEGIQRASVTEMKVETHERRGYRASIWPPCDHRTLTRITDEISYE